MSSRARPNRRCPPAASGAGSRPVLLLAALWLCAAQAATGAAAVPVTAQAPDEKVDRPPATAVATFAGGCFWCMEEAFDRVAGVLSTTSGYTGGHVPEPGYAQVTAGGTGHVEAVRVVYDPGRVGYEELLAVFWRNVDAMDGGGQFCDRGDSYASVIFAHDQRQRRLAEQSLARIEGPAGLGRPVRTRIAAAAPFYAAEDFHQDYWLRNPLRYSFYKYQCGREQRLRELWGEPAGSP